MIHRRNLAHVLCISIPIGLIFDAWFGEFYRGGPDATTVHRGGANISTNVTWSAATSHQPNWSVVVLDSEEYFFGNDLNLTFQTSVQVWRDSAKICLNVTLNDPENQCPYPDFRGRLSGVAIVNVPLSGIIEDPSAHRGCALFPVAGTYYLDVVLVHCTMNAWPEDITGKQLRRMCMLKPESRDVKNYSIEVEPFDRTEASVEQYWPKRNPFPRRAFIFSPICQGERFKVGPHCNNVSETNPLPSIARVNYQAEEKEANKQAEFFHKYVYLEVNPKNGTLNYDATYSVRRYAPPPRGFQSDDIVCFVGDSHGRYVSYQTKVIFQNRNKGKTGCSDRHLHTSNESSTGQFRYYKMNFGKEFVSEQGNDSVLFRDCNLVFILYGHWDAGYPKGRPTPPRRYLMWTHVVAERIQNITNEGTRIYIGTTNLHPLSERMIACMDWRFPALIDTYNTLLRNMTVPSERDGELRIEGLNNTYFMDNSDIMDHIWDSAADYCHPCDHGFRPMAYRVLALMRQKSTGKPTFWP